jgi:hypothetical protein
MDDGSSLERLQNLGLDPAAVRWTIVLTVSWFVGWTGLLLYDGSELVPALIQGVALALPLGVVVYLTRSYFARE